MNQKVKLFAIALFVMILNLIAIMGCGNSTPSVSAAREIVNPQLSKYGEIVGFEKINGEKFEVMGQKGYKFHYQAAVKLGKGWYWSQSFFGSELVQKSAINPFSFSSYKEVPEGAIYVEKGTIVFKMTDNGWVKDSTEISQHAYCTDKSPEQCYKASWGDELKSQKGN